MEWRDKNALNYRLMSQAQSVESLCNLVIALHCTGAALHYGTQSLSAWSAIFHSSFKDGCVVLFSVFCVDPTDKTIIPVY